MKLAVLHAAETAVTHLWSSSCEDAGEALGAAGFGAVVTGESLMGGRRAEESVGFALKGLETVLGAASVGFYSLSKFGAC